ncbi:MAG: ParA family protein, partial [Perlucidibaca sp.]
MARFIAVAQLKGGAGKSTIATNLAGCLARDFRTCLIDADMPQGTSARWAALRQDDNLLLTTAESASELAREAERLDDLC